MKHEWKKHEKELYTNVKKPTLITVPKQKFIMINGKGDPNQEDYAARIGILMSLAYPIKMRHKAYCKENPAAAASFFYEDYSVFPLEGIWTSTGDPLNKDNLVYTIMVRQPDFITEGMFAQALAVVAKKKPHPFLQEVKFDTIEDGLSVQMLHVGSYDDELISFAQMHNFIEENGLQRVDLACHREIYLSDPRKTSPERNKTILRYLVKEAGDVQ